MFTLSRELPRFVEMDGRRYKVDCAFDTVLRVFELQSDELFTPEQRVMLAAEIFGGRRVARMNPQDKIRFFDAVLDLLIGERDKQPGEKVFDFAQDAAYIYASFYAAYGMDLHNQKLDWRQFVALFQGLPDNTKIKEIISIRKRKIPAQTKYNREEIQHLIEAKAFYALKISEAEAEAQFQRGVDRLASSLAARAKGGG